MIFFFFKGLRIFSLKVLSFQNKPTFKNSNYLAFWLSIIQFIGMKKYIAQLIKYEGFGQSYISSASVLSTRTTIKETMLRLNADNPLDNWNQIRFEEICRRWFYLPGNPDRPIKICSLETSFKIFWCYKETHVDDSCNYCWNKWCQFNSEINNFSKPIDNTSTYPPIGPWFLKFRISGPPSQR